MSSWVNLLFISIICHILLNYILYAESSRIWTVRYYYGNHPEVGSRPTRFASVVLWRTSLLFGVSAESEMLYANFFFWILLDLSASFPNRPIKKIINNMPVIICKRWPHFYDCHRKTTKVIAISYSDHATPYRYRLMYAC